MKFSELFPNIDVIKKRSDYKTKNGIPVYHYVFKTNDNTPMTHQRAQLILNKFIENQKRIMMQKGYTENAFMYNTNIDFGIGPMGSIMMQAPEDGKEPYLYDFFLEYATKINETKHTGKKNYIQKTNFKTKDDLKYINNQFIVNVYRTNEKKGGLNENNDCLFRTLKAYYNGDLPFKYDYQLKKFLKLKKNDMVPIEKIKLIEDKIKCCIDIIGDCNLKSMCNYQKKITIKLQNNHYTPYYNKSTILLRGKLKQECNKLIVYDNKQYYDVDTDTIINFNNEKQFWEKRDTTTFYFKIDVYYLKNRYNGENPSLKIIYNDLIKDINELKKYDDRLNLLQYKTLKTMILNYFHYKSKFVMEPSQTDIIESNIILKTSIGALMYAKYGKYKNVYDYDVNSYYPWLMKQQSFLIPTGQPIYKKIDKLENIIQVGIYNCSITPHHKFFRFNKFNYYTHYDLTIARLLNLTITLNQDREFNFLYYDSKNRTNGKLMFGDYVDSIYKIKKNKNKLAKTLLNNLWGSLTEKNCRKKRLQVGSEYIYNDDEYISKIIMLDNKTEHANITFQNKIKVYKTPYFRLCPFLLSYGRLQLIKKIINYQKDIIYIHTDGFISKKKLDLKISDEIGDLKIVEKDGLRRENCNVEIFNITHVEFS